MSGYADVLVGLQYGDEGKAKVIDLLAPEYDIVARFNGGANAGHTVATERGTAKLMQVPSAAFHEQKTLYIGSGCAVNVVKLAAEIAQLRELGISMEGRLYISSRAALIQPHHLEVDRQEGRQIGTTGNGIGPCYADRAMRIRAGLRVGLQLKDLASDADSVYSTIDGNARRLGNAALDSSELAASLEELDAAWRQVESFVIDDPLFLTNKVCAGARVLFEGAQSVLLDVGYGDQPYVTASHTDPSFAYVGGDLNCKFHRRTIGVVKAIVSRVGMGSFPSELGGGKSADYCATAAELRRGAEYEAEKYVPSELLRTGDGFELGVALRMLTGEYGTGTGRPRRIGLIDIPQLSQTIQRFGVDEIFVNKVDCLCLFGETPAGKIPVVVKYLGTDQVPVLEELAIFDDAALRTSTPASVADPVLAFVRFLQAALGCEVRALGTGPMRSQVIYFRREK